MWVMSYFWLHSLVCMWHKGIVCGEGMYLVSLMFMVEVNL